MRFPWIGKAALQTIALVLALAHLALGQDEPNWVPISESVVAKVVGDAMHPENASRIGAKGLFLLDEREPNGKLRALLVSINR